MRIYVPLGSEFIFAEGFIPPLARQFEKPNEEWEDDPDILSNEGRAITDTKSGTKIYSESNKTVFANWSQVEPGETIVIKIKYRLPFKLEISREDNFKTVLDNFFNPNIKNLIPYALYAQKQPGSIGSELKSSLKLPNNYKIIWQYGDNFETSQYSWTLKNTLDTDKYWAVMIEAE